METNLDEDFILNKKKEPAAPKRPAKKSSGVSSLIKGEAIISDEDDEIFKEFMLSPVNEKPKKEPPRKKSTEITKSKQKTLPVITTSAPSTSKDVKKVDQNSCPICDKGLSHLSDARQLLHINSCLDGQESKDKLEKAKSKWDSTLDCPLCGEPQSAGPYRAAHVKRCARTHGVNGQRVLQLMETQTKVAENRRSRELPHTRAPAPILKEVKAAPLKNQPTSVNDEQLQLAKALSESLREDEDEAPPKVKSVRISEDEPFKRKMIPANSPAYTILDQARRKRRSYDIVAFAPDSCVCKHIQTGQARFLDVFRVRKVKSGSVPFSEVTSQRARRTDSFASHYSNAMEKLSRFSQLSWDLRALADSAHNTEPLKFSCKGGAMVDANRMLISVRTTVLKKKGVGCEVELNVTHEVCREWLRFVYSAKIEWSKNQNEEIMSLAETYGPEGLVRICKSRAGVVDDANEKCKSDGETTDKIGKGNIASEITKVDVALSPINEQISNKFEQAVIDKENLPESEMNNDSAEIKSGQRNSIKPNEINSSNSESLATTFYDCEDPFRGISLGRSPVCSTSADKNAPRDSKPPASKNSPITSVTVAKIPETTNSCETSPKKPCPSASITTHTSSTSKPKTVDDLIEHLASPFVSKVNSCRSLEEKPKDPVTLISGKPVSDEVCSSSSEKSSDAKTKDIINEISSRNVHDTFAKQRSTNSDIVLLEETPKKKILRKSVGSVGSSGKNSNIVRRSFSQVIPNSRDSFDETPTFFTQTSALRQTSPDMFDEDDDDIVECSPTAPKAKRTSSRFSLKATSAREDIELTFNNSILFDPFDDDRGYNPPHDHAESSAKNGGTLEDISFLCGRAAVRQESSVYSEVSDENNANRGMNAVNSEEHTELHNATPCSSADSMNDCVMRVVVDDATPSYDPTQITEKTKEPSPAPLFDSFDYGFNAEFNYGYYGNDDVIDLVTPSPDVVPVRELTPIREEDPSTSRPEKTSDQPDSFSTSPQHSREPDLFDKTTPKRRSSSLRPIEIDSFDISPEFVPPSKRIPQKRTNAASNIGQKEPSSLPFSLFDGVPPIAQSTPIQPAKRPRFGSHVKVLKTTAVTPAPNYATMTEEELKAELSRRGLRAMGKKRAIALLQQIYETTHPIVDPILAAAGDEKGSSTDEKESDNGGDELDKTLNDSDGQENLEETIMFEGDLPKDIDGMQRAFLSWIRQPTNHDIYIHMLALKQVSFEELYVRMKRADASVCKISKNALVAILDRLHVYASQEQTGGPRR